MMKTKHSHTISGVFVFFLLGVFAVSATLMVLLGAQVYKSGTDHANDHNAERIATAYLRRKVWEADSRDQIRPDEIDGAKALKIVNEEEETVTLLFVRDGMLCEWYTFQDLFDETAFDPETGAPLAAESDLQYDDEVEEGTAPGETVCPLDEMTLSVSGQLLTANLRNGDEWTAVDVVLRSASQ